MAAKMQIRNLRVKQFAYILPVSNTSKYEFIDGITSPVLHNLSIHDNM